MSFFKKRTRKAIYLSIQRIAGNIVYLKHNKVLLIYMLSASPFDNFDTNTKTKMVEDLAHTLLQVDDCSFVTLDYPESVEFDKTYFLKLKEGATDTQKWLCDLRLNELEAIENRKRKQTFLYIVTKEDQKDAVHNTVLNYFSPYYIKATNEHDTKQFLYKLFNCTIEHVPETNISIDTLYPFKMKEYEMYMQIDDTRFLSILAAYDFKSLYNQAGFFRDTMFSDKVMLSKINIKSILEYDANAFLQKSFDEMNIRLSSMKAGYDRTILETQVERMDSLIRSIHEGTEKLVLIEYFVVLTADTKENIFKKIKQFVQNAKSSGLFFTSSFWEQKKLYQRLLNNEVKDFGTGTTFRSVAGGYPIAMRSFVQTNGVYIGETKGSYPVRLNISYRDQQYTNGNIVVYGKSGSGKSTLIKTLGESEVTRGHALLIADPQGEYDEYVKYLGGLVVSEKDCAINMLEIMQTVDDFESSMALLERTVERVLVFCKYYRPDFDRNHFSVLRDLLFKTYDRFNINGHTALQHLESKQYPIFSDVYDTFKTYKNEQTSIPSIEMQSILTTLDLFFSEITQGRGARLFNTHTQFQVDTDRALVINFNLKELLNDELLLQGYLFTVFNYMQHILYKNDLNNKWTTILVDEAHNLLTDQNVLGAQRQAKFAKEIRKFKGNYWFITQNPSDVFVNNLEVQKHALAIQSNAQYLFLLHLKQNDIELLNEKNGNDLLTEADKNYLRHAKQGDVLMLTNEVPYQFKVIPNKQSIKHYGGTSS